MRALLGNCGPSPLAAGIGGLRDGPRGREGRGRAPGRAGPRGGGARGQGGPAGRGRGAAGARAGRGGRRGRGRAGMGRKQCSRRGPGRLPLPSAAAEGRSRSVAAGAVRAGPGRGAPRTPRRGGSGGHRRLGRGNAGPAAGGRPAGTPPRQDPRAGCGVGGGGRAAAAERLARGSAGGRAQAWLEEARPGSSARGSAPARGSPPDARRGVGRGAGAGWRAPCRAPGRGGRGPRAASTRPPAGRVSLRAARPPRQLPGAAPPCRRACGRAWALFRCARAEGASLAAVSVYSFTSGRLMALTARQARLWTPSWLPRSCQ